MSSIDSLSESLLKQPLSTALVTGGGGGLGNQILLLLASRKCCSALHSLDLRALLEPIDDVSYHTADLTDKSAIDALFEELKPNVVIHCASPRFDASKDIMQKVNVEGTRVLVEAAIAAGTKAFVYTSSAGVVSDGRTDLRGADESYPKVTGEDQPDFYVNTKALAETYVLSQNRPSNRSDFVTCALRPSGIFGIGDFWVLPGILEAYKRGQTKVQIGNNTNLFEFSENTNVAHAHHLAAAALVQSSTSSKPESDRVDGEAFFITNDEPLPFWDFTRMAWRFAGDKTQPHQIWTISRTLGMVIASILEWSFWLLGLGLPPLTRQKVRLSCMTRYYSVEKAKQRLGYRPLIGLQEGLKRGMEDCMKRNRERMDSSKDLKK